MTVGATLSDSVFDSIAELHDEIADEGGLDVFIITVEGVAGDTRIR